MSVSLSPLAGAGWQFFDNNGVPLNGGLLYTYAAGTTTPTATYTSDNGVTANANPIVLDSAGRTPSEVWLTNGTTYKIAVYTSTNVLIRTWDDIAGVNDSAALEATLASSTGSSMIGFIQAGTGAVTRTSQDKMREVVSVKDFGAVGDGVINDTTAIQAAINYAITVAPSRVVFPTATYKCNAVLGSFKGSNIEIDFQGSVLDFSGLSLASVGPLLEFAGVYSSTAALTATAVAGSKSLAVDSSGFAASDMVRVYSTAVWDSTRTSTRIGEISFIETIPSGASVELTTELQTGYATANTATLQKLIPVINVTIRNGSIRGPSGNDELLGLRIRVGESCLIENIKSYDVDKIHLQLTDCVFSKVTKCHFEQSNHSAQAYGVSFADACQDCTAIDNSFVDVRHSLSTNNNVNTSYGIVRRILFANNIVSDSAEATGGTGGDAIDTHAGAEDIFILGNTVNSSSNYGINFEARTGAVSNNYIKNTASGGILINPRADGASTITVTGNTLLNIGDAVAEYGIYVVAQTADMVNCVISGNRVVAFAQPARVVGISPYTVSRLAISGNTLQKSSASTTLNGIEVERSNYTSVTGNSVLAGAVGIVLTDCSNSTVTGNTVEITNTSGPNGWGVRLSGTGAYNCVSSNTVSYTASGLTTLIGITFQPSTITYSGAWNNVAQNFTTSVNVSTGTGNVAANNI